MPQKNKQLILTVALLLAVVALSCGFFVAEHVRSMKRIDRARFNGTLLDTPREVVHFTLMGTDQQPFNQASLTQHWTMMFFGFTRCGMVCPTTMAELSKMIRLLSDRKVSPLPRVVMVSIDPESDTLPRLKSYVEAFNPDFYGATGKIDEISRITQDFGIAYAKIARKLKNGSVVHDIEHTGAILLFNPKGQLMAFFTTPHNAAGLADDYQLLIG